MSPPSTKRRRLNKDGEAKNSNANRQREIIIVGKGYIWNLGDDTIGRRAYAITVNSANS